MARTVTDELVTVLGYETEGVGEAEKYQRRLGNLKGGVSRFADAVVGFGLAISAGLSVLIGGSITRATIRTNAELEQMMQTLITIEGSSDKAKESFKWITEFSDDIPLSIQEIKQAFIQLKSFGIDPIANDTLRLLGDAASAMEVPFTDSIDAFNNATTGIFQNLKRFGLNVRDEGDKLNIMWGEHGKQMKATIKDDSESIQRFLLDNFERRFGGALTRQANTWFGLIQKMGNQWTLFLSDIGKAGVFDTAKKKISELLSIIKVWRDDGSLTFWAQQISDIESAAIEKIAFIIKNVGLNIKFLYQNIDRLMPLLNALSVVGAVLLVVYAPISSSILAFVLILDSLIVMMQGGDSMIGRFIKSSSVLSGLFKTIKERFTAVLDSIRELTVSDEFARLLDSVGRILSLLLLLVVDFALIMVQNLLYIMKNWEEFRPLFIAIGAAIAAFILAFNPLTVILGGIIFLFNDLMSLFLGGKSYIWDLISSLNTLAGWWNLLKIVMLGVAIIFGALLFKFATSIIALGLAWLAFKKLATLFPILKVLQFLFLALNVHMRAFLISLGLSFVPFVTAGHIALHIFTTMLAFVMTQFKKMRIALLPLMTALRTFGTVIGALFLRFFSFGALRILFLRLAGFMIGIFSGPIGWIILALSLIGPTIYDSLLENEAAIKSWFSNLGTWLMGLLPDWLKNLFTGLGEGNLQVAGATFGSNPLQAFDRTLPGSIPQGQLPQPKNLNSTVTVNSNVTQNIGQPGEAADQAGFATADAVEGAAVEQAARFSREPQLVP